MIKNSYLHIPTTFTKSMRTSIVLNADTETEETYLYWAVYPDSKETVGVFGDYFTIPIDHQESVSIDNVYKYSDLSVSLMVSDNLFQLFLKAANQLLVIVDFDNIPRTPFISSSTRMAGANAWKVSLSLKPFNCYRMYKPEWVDGDVFYIPESEYVSYKALYDGISVLRFDTQYTLLRTQSEV